VARIAERFKIRTDGTDINELGHGRHPGIGRCRVPRAEPRRVIARSLRPNQGYRAKAHRARLPNPYSYARWPLCPHPQLRPLRCPTRGPDAGYADGGAGIGVDAAREVAHYLIGEMLRLACPFDLRLLVNNAIPDYQQWKDGESESNWRDLITASIEQHLVAVRHPDLHPVTREERKGEEHAILREIDSSYPSRDDRVRVWIERTGKSERAFYRRLAELH
jgi:hypothetical protein